MSARATRSIPCWLPVVMRMSSACAGTPCLARSVTIELAQRPEPLGCRITERARSLGLHDVVDAAADQAIGQKIGRWLHLREVDHVAARAPIEALCPAQCLELGRACHERLPGQPPSGRSRLGSPKRPHRARRRCRGRGRGHEARGFEIRIRADHRVAVRSELGGQVASAAGGNRLETPGSECGKRFGRRAACRAARCWSWRGQCRCCVHWRPRDWSSDSSKDRTNIGPSSDFLASKRVQH